jgi:hypothetical protein
MILYFFGGDDPTTQTSPPGTAISQAAALAGLGHMPQGVLPSQLVLGASANHRGCSSDSSQIFFLG